MPPTPSRITAAVGPRCGVSRFTSRTAEPLKSRERSVGGRAPCRAMRRVRGAGVTAASRRPDSDRLRVRELRVGGAVGQQRLVGAGAHHLAVVDDDDLVGAR